MRGAGRSGVVEGETRIAFRWLDCGIGLRPTPLIRLGAARRATFSHKGRRKRAAAFREPRYRGCRGTPTPGPSPQGGGGRGGGIPRGAPLCRLRRHLPHEGGDRQLRHRARIFRFRNVRGGGGTSAFLLPLWEKEGPDPTRRPCGPRLTPTRGKIGSASIAKPCSSCGKGRQALSGDHVGERLGRPLPNRFPSLPNRRPMTRGYISPGGDQASASSGMRSTWPG